MNTETMPTLTDELVDKLMEQAQIFASSWSMVGGPFDNGDGLANSNAMKAELRTMIRDALSSPPLSAPPEGWRQPKIDLREIAEQAGISMDLWDMGAASLAHSEGVEGVTRDHLERFASLWGIACWNAALEANPASMESIVDRGIAGLMAASGVADNLVALERAVSVMDDVLTDIEDWEDKALAEAVSASRDDLQAWRDSIRMTASCKEEGDAPKEPKA